MEPSFVLQAELARFEKEVRENLCEHLQCKPLQNESQITRIGAQHKVARFATRDKNDMTAVAMLLDEMRVKGYRVAYKPYGVAPAALVPGSFASEAAIQAFHTLTSLQDLVLVVLPPYGQSVLESFGAEFGIDATEGTTFYANNKLVALMTTHRDQSFVASI